MIISSAIAKGARLEQEDRFVIHKARTGTLFAVIDGHGGKEVADVCNDYLASFWDVTGPERPIDKALELVIWQLDAITNEYPSGASISLAFVPHDEATVYTCILGDCPVIVRSPDGITHVSTSHNARTNVQEREDAIKRGGVYSGGYIWNEPGPYGLGLQMTRSLGDSGMGPVVSKAPTSERHPFGDFLLLATDGVFTPSHENELEAIAAVLALIDSGGGAQTIVDHAVALPTGDNATAILIRKGEVSINEVA